MKEKISLFVIILLLSLHFTLAQSSVIERSFDTYGNLIIRLIAGVLVAVALIIGAERLAASLKVSDRLKNTYIAAGRVFGFILGVIIMFALPSSFVLSLYTYITENQTAVLIIVLSLSFAFILINRYVSKHPLSFNYKEKESWPTIIVFLCLGIIIVLVVLTFLLPSLFDISTPAGELGSSIRDIIIAVVVIALIISTFLVGKVNAGYGSSSGKSKEEKKKRERGLDSEKEIWDLWHSIIKRAIDLWEGKGEAEGLGLSKNVVESKKGLHPDLYEELIKKDKNEIISLFDARLWGNHVKKIKEDISILERKIKMAIRYDLKSGKLDSGTKNNLKKDLKYVQRAKRYVNYNSYIAALGNGGIKAVISNMRIYVLKKGATGGEKGDLAAYQLNYAVLVFFLGAAINMLDDETIPLKRYKENTDFYEKNKKSIEELKKIGNAEKFNKWGILAFDESAVMPSVDEIFKKIYDVALKLNKGEVNTIPKAAKELTSVKTEIEVALRRVRGVI